MNFTMKCPTCEQGPTCAECPTCKGVGEIDKYGPKPIREITEARYWEMLEVLPPCKWRHSAGGESFHVSEYMSGNFVNWFVCIGKSNYGGRYFAIDDVDTLTPAELTRRAREYIAAHPEPIAATAEESA